MKGTTAALVFFVIRAVAAGAPALQADGEESAVPRFVHEDEVATRALAATADVDRDAIPAALKDSSPRVRAKAADALRERGSPAFEDLLIEAFLKEADREVERRLAAALEHFGAAVHGRLKEAPEFCGRKLRAYLAERTRLGLGRIIGENTDPDGSFKGFYDEQFDSMADLGPDGDSYLGAIALDPTYSLTYRRAAIRALGSTGRAAVLPALWKVRAEHIRRAGLDEQGAQWRIGGARRDFWDDPIVEYVDYALFHAGDRRGLDYRLQHFMGEEERWRASLAFVGADDRKVVRMYLAEALFRVAYCHMQYKDNAKSVQMMTDIARNYADTGYASTAWYNVACVESRAGRLDAALDALDKSIRAGYLDAVWIHKDGDLRALRADPRFLKLMEGHGFPPGN